MAHLNFLHSYSDGDVLSSANWNSELDQILYGLGYEISNASTFIFMFSDSTDAVNDAILRLTGLLTGDIIQWGNGTLSSLISSNGQVVLGANGVVPFIVASTIECPNLNADLLNSLDSTAFELDLFQAHGHFVYYHSSALLANSGMASWISPSAGFITKLRIKQEIVASGDASTIITILKNGVSIGTASIAGNLTTVQTNDIVDVPIIAGDIISYTVTTYTGTTKHEHVTVGFNYKQRAFNP